jgi:tetratricopeptide (TPR) repeat protein
MAKNYSPSPLKPMDARGSVAAAALMPIAPKNANDLSMKAIQGDAASREAIDRLMVVATKIKGEGVVKCLEQALSCFKQEQWKEGGDFAIKALNIDEKSGLSWHVLAISRDKCDDFQSALSCYETALKLLPDNLPIVNDLGRLAYRLGLHDMAEKFFQFFLAREPFHSEVINNYASSLRENNRLDDAVNLLRPAIENDPTNASLWNCLATVVNAQGNLEAALLFFNEALACDPDNVYALYNSTNVLAAMGQLPEALDRAFEASKRFTDLSNTYACNLVISYISLALGDLKTGWDHYDARKRIGTLEGMKYVVDLSELDLSGDLKGKSIFVSTEQGLGDEILFGTLLPDILAELGPQGQLTLGVEPRLVSLFQRSFPNIKVTRHHTTKLDGHTYRVFPDLGSTQDFDGFALIGDFIKRYRQTVEAFPHSNAFLIPDPERVLYWQERLAELGDRPKIGLLWKSMIKHSERDRLYSPFEQWQKIMTTPDVTFVNLQYGDVSEEMALAKAAGINIWNPPTIDLKADLDDLSALCKAMDLIMGPSNATSNIAAAVGVPIWIVTPQSAWAMLGTDYYPWYPTARMFVTKRLDDWSEVMDNVHQALKDAHLNTPKSDAIGFVPTHHKPVSEITSVKHALERALMMRDWPEANLLAEKLTKLAPELTEGWQGLALSFDRQNKLPEALESYQKALSTAPHSVELAADLAQLAFRLRLYDMAEKFYGYVIEKDPTHLIAVNFYAAALREQSKYDEGIEVLKAYLGQYPKRADFWDTLGTLVIAQGDYENALIFFNESLGLNSNLQARFNRACAMAEMGWLAQALPDLEVCAEGFSEPTNQASAKLTLAQAKLSLGDLREGYRLYEARNMTGTPLEVIYDLGLTRLNPEDIESGTPILVMAEQGLGDEVMFGTMILDIIQKLGGAQYLTLSVEPRLVDLLARSFENVNVVAHKTFIKDGLRHRSLAQDIDFNTLRGFVLLADYLTVLRPNISDFKDKGAYLIPNPDRVAYWQAKLKTLGTGPKIGLLWKSLKSDSRRQRYYANFEQWQDVLKTKGLVFINLQYGEVSEDIAYAKALGIEIYHPPFDLMNDLDELSALCKAVDLIIGPSNATSNIAAACGSELWLLAPFTSWTQLGAAFYPWYPKVRLFTPDQAGGWESLMKNLGHALNDLN